MGCASTHSKHPTVKTNNSTEPSGTFPTGVMTLGVNPRTGTYSVLGRLSRRTSVIGVLWQDK